jgi:hypothetical protein
MEDPRPRVPLRIIHDENSFSRSSLAYWRSKQSDFVLKSLLDPASPDYEPLAVRHDGTVLNGNTRLFVLQQGGYDINTIPWVPIP